MPLGNQLAFPALDFGYGPSPRNFVSLAKGQDAPYLNKGVHNLLNAWVAKSVLKGPLHCPVSASQLL